MTHALTHNMHAQNYTDDDIFFFFFSTAHSAMDKYENLGLVGEGSYGLVMKCRHKVHVRKSGISAHNWMPNTYIPNMAWSACAMPK